MERRVGFSRRTCIHFCLFYQEGGFWGWEHPAGSAGVPITHALIFSIILANHSLALKNWQLIIKWCFCRIQIFNLFSLLGPDNFHYLVCQPFSKCYQIQLYAKSRRRAFCPCEVKSWDNILSKTMREVLRRGVDSVLHTRVGHPARWLGWPRGQTTVAGAGQRHFQKESQHQCQDGQFKSKFSILSLHRPRTEADGMSKQGNGSTFFFL